MARKPRPNKYPGMDWDRCFDELLPHGDRLDPLLESFLAEHPEWDLYAFICSHPPQIELRFWMPAPDKTKRGSVGIDSLSLKPRKRDAEFQPEDDSDMRVSPDYIRVIKNHTDDELALIADFVAQIAPPLVARRAKDVLKQPHILEYELRPNYDAYRNKTDH